VALPFALRHGAQADGFAERAKLAEDFLVAQTCFALRHGDFDVATQERAAPVAQFLRDGRRQAADRSKGRDAKEQAKKQKAQAAKAQMQVAPGDAPD
jgi:hypothetical protein